MKKKFTSVKNARGRNSSFSLRYSSFLVILLFIVTSFMIAVPAKIEKEKKK
jgi:hypothetical protein